MSEVLPTDCSPRNTSLNFLSGLPKSPEVDMVAVVQCTLAILSLTPQSLLFTAAVAFVPISGWHGDNMIE